MIPYSELVQALAAWRQKQGLPVLQAQYVQARHPAFPEGSQPSAARPDESEVLVSAEDFINDEEEETVVNHADPRNYFSNQNPRGSDRRPG
jgi:hypothetical protein